MRRFYYYKNAGRHKCLSICRILMWVAICCSIALRSFAEKNPSEIELPASLTPGLSHLLKIVDPDIKESFNPQRVDDVLDFVAGTKLSDALYYADEDFGSTSAYDEIDIRRSLKQLLEYAFNPDIPYVATAPSTIRRSRWQQLNGNGGAIAKPWQFLKALEHPVIFKGLEFLENTPDLFSGAYYAYHLHRLVILMKHRQHNVLISLSKQRDISDVGKKGYILGSDDDWDYFYSGKTGLTITGLGWIRSYMYDSIGISIYYEIDSKAPLVRCAFFKWLKAGWSKINVVKKKHIYRGMKRFADAFKEIIEYPQLPAPDELASAFSKIEKLSLDELRKKILVYRQFLKKRYGQQRPKSPKWPVDIFDNNGYWQKLSKEEMQSLLAVEYMKYVLGKTPKAQAGNLLNLAE